MCDALQVMSRMKQYKDDLLASCLSLILALPPQIVVSEMAAIVPALQVSYTPHIIAQSHNIDIITIICDRHCSGDSFVLLPLLVLSVCNHLVIVTYNATVAAMLHCV